MIEWMCRVVEKFKYEYIFWIVVRLKWWVIRMFEYLILEIKMIVFCCGVMMYGVVSVCYLVGSWSDIYV